MRNALVFLVWMVKESFVTAYLDENVREESFLWLKLDLLNEGFIKNASLYFMSTTLIITRSQLNSSYIIFINNYLHLNQKMTQLCHHKVLFCYVM